MTPQFLTAWELTLSREGGYVDNPKDRGGPTRFGISEQVARAHGYDGDMADLPLDDAKAIAKGQYWDLLSLDLVAALSTSVAYELFDTGFNMGVATAARYCQRALNVLNRETRDYGDLVVDGVLGRLTVANLAAFLRVRRVAGGERVLIRALNCLQGARYVDLAEAREANEEFVFGWLSSRVK